MTPNELKTTKLLAWYMYFGVTIITLVIGFASKDLGPQRLLFIIIYCIAMLLLHRLLSTWSKISIVLHSIITVVLIYMLAFEAGSIVGKITVYQMLSIVPLITCLIYSNSNVFKWNGVFMVSGYVFAMIFNYPGYAYKPDLEESVIYIFVTIMLNLVLYAYAGRSQMQVRQNIEVEQSLDDLLKVVYAKCNDARAATKSKSDFLSSMSHEIRTPINAIMGMNELILQSTGDEEIIGYADNIERSGTILLGLINDILDFSKIESGKMELVNVTYQMSSVLNDLINMIQSRAEQKNLIFRVDISEEIPNKLIGDDLRLRQVVTNLLTNAVKYTEKGEVCLRVSHENLNDQKVKLIFEVSDTGQGMKEESIARLYDSFSRFDEKKNRQIEGTGLGMAIVKQIVDMSHGEITVESTYGEGTTFHVEIPQTVSDATRMGNFQENFRKSRTLNNRMSSFIAPNAKILIVDDNELNLEVAKGLLKSVKAQVVLARSGEECLQHLIQDTFDLVLLDHMMPQMDGIETLAEIKKRSLARTTPILALTANAVSGAKEQYLQAGFDDYLTKPISSETMYRTISRWISPTKIIQLSEEEKEQRLVNRKREEKKQTVASAQRRVGKRKAFDAMDWSLFFVKYVNMEQALLFSIDGKDGVKENVYSFKETASEQLAKLEKCLLAEDYGAYQNHVRAIDSIATAVGMEPLYMLARQLANVCQSGEIEKLKQLHPKLVEYLTEILEAIK